MKYYLGIDPGTNGGATILNESGEIEVILSHKKTTPQDYLDTIRSYANSKGGIAHAIVEKVHSFPRQGVSSSFTFGTSFGEAKRTCECFQIPFQLITPQKWQKFLSIEKKRKEESKNDFKKRLKEEAQKIYPQDKFTLETADSVLIAHAAFLNSYYKLKI